MKKGTRVPAMLLATAIATAGCATAQSSRPSFAERLKAKKEGRDTELPCEVAAVQLNNEALVAWNARDYEAGMMKVQRALRIDPECADALVNRGLIKGSQRDLPGAIDDFSAAIQIDPTHALAYMNRGLYKSLIEDAPRYYEAGLADENKALQIDPDMVDALHNRALMLTALFREEEAKRDIDRVLQLAPERREWLERSLDQARRLRKR